MALKSRRNGAKSSVKTSKNIFSEKASWVRRILISHHCRDEIGRVIDRNI